jgi:diaminopimelate epimerase
VELSFTKMHGLGNDFIVIDDRAGELELSPDAVAYFCDRHYGIGADGLMLVRESESPDADFAWWFRNSDGSVAEMCGNGIRCFAKFLVDRGLVPAEQQVVRVETAVGILSIEVTRDDHGRLGLATVDMGQPILDPARIPTEMRCGSNEDMVISCDLETELGTFSVTPISMGNPHCVLFVDDVDTAPVHTLGPVIENHPMFPKKTNVEFAQLMGDDTIRLRVWERGCGETLACGTGACATAVAASLNCRGGRHAHIQLPGGDLDIRWAEDGRVFMTGPAAEVFTGTLVIEEDDES